jgi:hypothetical protein
VKENGYREMEPSDFTQLIKFFSMKGKDELSFDEFQ